MSLTRFLVLVPAVGMAACLPFPTHGPQVRPGFGMAMTATLNAVEQTRWDFDTTRRTQLLPDVVPSVWTAVGPRDGRGPALRVAVGGLLATIPHVDAYVQAPTVGRFSSGIGTIVMPYDSAAWLVSPYAMAGWESTERVVYVAHNYVPAGGRTDRSASVTMVGWQPKRPVIAGGRSVVEGRTYFAALFRGASVGPTYSIFLGPQSQIRSVVAVGVRAEIAFWRPYEAPRGGPFRLATDPAPVPQRPPNR